MATAAALTRPDPPLESAKPRIRVAINETIRIPESVVDLETFRRWARSDDFPERARLSFAANAVWVEVSMEQIYTHNQVKAAYTFGLMGLPEQNVLGRYFPDGVFLTNVAAKLATIPDGMYVRFDSIRKQRIRRLEGEDGGYTEWQGSPDMVLEVVSNASLEKDMVALRAAYWRARVAEYWLVDARDWTDIHFDILRRGSRGFVPTRRQADGWLKSQVFKRNFRRDQRPDPLGDPIFTLRVR